ncbi:putative MFS family arabinose efflux permease [Raoultella planticola]|uniref:MFS transporter n=1 Tax=Raoultella planticola TaxID=575 RepID=UPI00106395DF|nr:MFS transporter [Raoultella planticola]QEU43305.1 MFS transporter [Raoultella planticola]TDV07365.1 putative MFS family arabinose efflux permease [Raoultella planticola]TDX37235.1 putative MFS family arabinose efflux permease [Raoultella planticola]
MPEPVDEPALNGVRLNLRIVSVVMFNFASYLTIGLPLAVLPGYVHDVMGFSAFWAGLVISLQYFATLLSRPHAGRYADLLGPKKIVIFGLCGCFLSGLSYLLAAVGSGWPIFSLALLCLGRVILGIGQSFAGTGSTLWGVGVVGSLHIGRVISLNGIVTYGAMAMGAPLGVLCYSLVGLPGLAWAIMAVALVAILCALPRAAVRATKGKAMTFRAVLGRVWPYGMALALASAGFGTIATFITLFYDAKGWDGAAFALTLFSCAFVGTRLLFPNGINRLGGLNVAMLCFSVEIVGLLLVGLAETSPIAKVGTFFAGAGFSLVFPALGVVAVKAVPQQNQGSALATYTVFMDLSLGITGPLAGLLMAWAGISTIYLAAAGLVAVALLLSWRLKKRPPAVAPEAATSGQ